MDNKLITVISVAVIVIVLAAGGSFAGGYAVGKSQAAIAPTADQQTPTDNGRGPGNAPNGQGWNPQGQGQGPGGRFRGGFRGGISGSVESISGDTVTVKKSDGTTQTITLSSDSKINKSQTASRNDITVGTNVMVMGIPDANGNVTARNVTIEP